MLNKTTRILQCNLRTYLFSTFCVPLVLYLYIYIALFAVHTNHKRFQSERPREKRAVSRERNEAHGLPVNNVIACRWYFYLSNRDHNGNHYTASRIQESIALFTPMTDPEPSTRGYLIKAPDDFELESGSDLGVGEVGGCLRRKISPVLHYSEAALIRSQCSK